jgi:2Fe-2S ferredoxin
MGTATGELRLPESAEAFDGAVTIRVVDRDGVEHRLPALEGWRVMEVIRDWGLDLKAECGGACACATCHVHVDEEWAARLPQPIDDEVDRLDDAFEVTEASRLSCQLLVTPELDGLRLRLAPGTEK